VSESLAKQIQQAAVVALNLDANESDRLSAVRLLALSDAGLTERTLSELLTPQSSPALQQAAVKSLATLGTLKAFATMIESWKSFGPATRREIVDNLVQTADGAKALLRAVETAAIKLGEIERDKRQLLLNHPQTTIRDIAKIVLAEPPSNRKQVVADYQPTLELMGDAARGRMLYTRTCLQCHRAGTIGNQVGPDFASVQNKSPADLLVAILDPNREAQPNFQTYTAVTKQGKVHSGIISAETAASLTLKRAEAKEDVIIRETLDDLVSNGISLMPEGLEKDLNQQQLADIIAAIKSGQ
jgi:putative heme-binding domain-containing protein